MSFQDGGLLLKRSFFLFFFCAARVRSDTETADDPVREMLLAHFETVQ